MEAEVRRNFALATILGLVVLISLGWFLWSNFLNFGTLQISGPAPFSFSEEGEVLQCAESPCEIELSAKRHTFIISKEGFDSVVETVLIERGKTTEISADFKLNTYIQEAPDYQPAIPETPNYKLVFDEGSQTQRLLGDGNEVLIIFPERLTSPKIFASKNAAIILSEDGNYRIDLKAKTRKLIEELEIGQGLWSPDGQYFAFVKDDVQGFFVFGPENDLEGVTGEVDFESFSWTSDNRLLFMEGKELKMYNPKIEITSSLHYFVDFDDVSNLKGGPGLDSVFFKSGEQGYQLILEN